MDEVSYKRGIPRDLIGQVSEAVPFFYQPEFVVRNGEEGLVAYSLQKSSQPLAFIHFKLVTI